MSFAQCTRAIATTFLGLMSIQVGAMAQQDTPPASCPVTLPSPGKVPAIAFGLGTDGRVAAFGNAQLWTVLPIDGTWRGILPTKPGDYAYSNKLPWGGRTFSVKDEPLIVKGKRLDGPAPLFTEIEPISWKQEFMGGINIPVFGCWQVTGKYKDQELQFVVWVTPIQQQTKQISQDVEPKSAPRRVRLNSEIEAESLVYRVTPETPHEAKVANISGTVVLDAVIGIDGRPHNLRYVSGPLILAQAAIDAVTWWEYRINDLDVEVDTTIPVVFSAED
jgi:TonB-like protein